MNVFTIVTIIITGVCLTWSLGLYIFYRVKKHRVEKAAKKDLENESKREETSK